MLIKRLFYTLAIVICTCLPSPAQCADADEGKWMKVINWFQQLGQSSNSITTPSPKFVAQVKSMPKGYQDSKDWDFDAVMRLLEAMKTNGADKLLDSLRSYLRRPPTRRVHSPQYLDEETYKELNRDVDELDYYDSDSDDDNDQPWDSRNKSNKDEGKDRGYDDDYIIHISNPVEARLPSSHISVDMLKRILVNRALAERELLNIPNKRPGSKKKVIDDKDDGGDGEDGGNDDRVGTYMYEQLRNIG